jgi:hypothetical protein
MTSCDLPLNAASREFLQSAGNATSGAAPVLTKDNGIGRKCGKVGMKLLFDIC